MKDKRYIELLSEIKQKIKEAQVKTVVAANSQMLLLYWQLGNYILSSQRAKGWGSKIIDQLAADLKKEFPKLKGFSPRNILYMKQFANAYNRNVLSSFIQIETQLMQSNSITQQLVAQLLVIGNDEFAIGQQPAAQLEKSAELIMQPTVT